MESAQRLVQNDLVSREQIESMIKDKVAHLEAKLNLEEVNRKAMTLKVKATRNNYQRGQQNLWENSEDNNDGSKNTAS